MSIRDVYLPILDSYRAKLAAVWDLRRFDVTVRVTTWSPGTLPGAYGATPVIVDTPLTVGGGERPKVEQLSQRTIIASGGLYEDRDLKIGPLTPSYQGGGIVPAVFDPALSSTAEILFLVDGPGLPTGGALYKKVGQEATGNFHYSIIVRATGAEP